MPLVPQNASCSKGKGQGQLLGKARLADLFLIVQAAMLRQCNVERSMQNAVQSSAGRRYALPLLMLSLAQQKSCLCFV